MSNELELCSICLESLQGRKKKYTTECRHVFHKTCLKTACLTHNVCPLCRENIEVDCREIIGHKSNEMPAGRIQIILKNARNIQRYDEIIISQMRTQLLSMKFQRGTEWNRIHSLSDFQRKS